MDKDYLDMDSGWSRGAQPWTVDTPQLVRAMRQFKDYLEAGKGIHPGSKDIVPQFQKTTTPTETIKAHQEYI